MPIVKQIQILTSPLTVPKVLVDKTRENFRRALESGEVLNRFIATLDDPSRWFVPASENGVSLDPPKTFGKGYSGSVGDLKRRAGLQASTEKRSSEMIAYLEDPERIARSVAKLDRNWQRNAERGLRSGGGPLDLQRAAAAGVMLMAGDKRGEAAVRAGLIRVIHNDDPAFSVFRADARKTAITTGTQMIQQALSFTLLAQSVGFGSQDITSPTAQAIAELQTRTESALLSLAAPGVLTIVFRVIQEPTGAELRALT